MTGNRADLDGASTTFGGGISSSGATITLNNSVVAENTSGSALVANDVDDSIRNATHSFFGTTTTVTGTNVNNINGGGDPGLLALADNGGTTQTQNLTANSPLLNSGSNAVVPAGLNTDANGNARIFHEKVDIGATEIIQPLAISFERLSPASELTNSDSLVFRATFSEPVTNVDASDFEATGTTATATLTGSGDIYEVTLSGGGPCKPERCGWAGFKSHPRHCQFRRPSLLSTEPVIDETYILDNAGPTYGLSTPVARSSHNLFDFPGIIALSVSDPSGIASVEIAVRTPFSRFFDGTSFSSTTPVYFSATDLGNGKFFNSPFCYKFSFRSKLLRHSSSN